MTEIALAYPLVRIEAPGVPEPVLAQVMADTVRDFFSQSECWRYTVPGLLDWTMAQPFPDVTPGTEIPTGTRVVRIDEVKWASDGQSLRPISFYTRQNMDEVFSDWEVKTGSSPQAWTNDPTPDSPVIVPIATADVLSSIKLRVILTTTTLTDIPDFFYEEFHDAFRWGCLARLLKMPEKDWSNPNLAMVYEGMFQSEIVKAKSRAEAEFGQPNNRTMAYGGL